MTNGALSRRALLFQAAAARLLWSQELTAEWKEKIDAALPATAPAKPRRARRVLVTNLSMRDGKPVRGSSFRTLPAGNYALAEMGKRTGAFEAVFRDDVEMFRRDRLREFDALCFQNTLGVLFDDAELKESLLSYVREGRGFVGIHDAIATFVQYPKYDQWPAFGEMLGATENGGHPWNGETMTIRVEDPGNPLNAAFGGKPFAIADQAFQFQEPLLRDHLHVLLSIDAEKTGLAPNRRILPARKDLDFPMSWIRRYGEGRVFYLGFGHGPEVFWHSGLMAHLLAGIQYALGDLPANDRPSGPREQGR
jgi:type 1 glutamine amidotransferase